jgi:hypothetical protein
MSNTIKVKFTEAISSGVGSFAPGEVAHLPTHIATPWLKTGQVVYSDAAEKTRVEKTTSPKATPLELKKPEAPDLSAVKAPEEADLG